MYLMFAAQRLHFRANCMRDLSADIRVDLIEDQQWDRVVRGERGFDCQHQARDFAARCDGAKRL